MIQYFLRTSVTENVTIPAGVNIASWSGGSANTPSITGTVTMTAAGTSTISGVGLITNSSFCIAVTGSAASILNINNCYINGLNNTAISFTSSSSSATITLFECTGNLGTTGIAYFASSSAGTLNINNCYFGNSGSSVTASTVSAGSVSINASNFFNNITTSSTGGFSGTTSYIGMPGLNSIALNHGSSVTTGLGYCQLYGGSSAAININASSTVICSDCALTSSATNAVTGTGTFQFGKLFFVSSTGLASGLTLNSTDKMKFGVYQSPVQPCFFATKTSTATNQTGNGATVTVLFDNVLKDQNSNYTAGSGTFTAPFTGTYILGTNLFTNNFLSGCNEVVIQFSGTIASGYGLPFIKLPVPSNTVAQAFHLVDAIPLTAGDTVTVTLQISGGASNGVGIQGSASLMNTIFWGYLLC